MNETPKPNPIAQKAVGPVGGHPGPVIAVTAVTAAGTSKLPVPVAPTGKPTTKKRPAPAAARGVVRSIIVPTVGATSGVVVARANVVNRQVTGGVTGVPPVASPSNKRMRYNTIARGGAGRIRGTASTMQSPSAPISTPQQHKAMPMMKQQIIRVPQIRVPQIQHPKPQRQSLTQPQDPSASNSNNNSNSNISAGTAGSSNSGGSQSNEIYDVMLGEISDLLMAAQQAQTLGRLKMASTYLLLVHARLVGLGKRFDRFLAHGQSSIPNNNQAHNNQNNKNKVAVNSNAERTLSFPPVPVVDKGATTNGRNINGTAVAAGPSNPTDTASIGTVNSVTPHKYPNTGGRPLNPGAGMTATPSKNHMPTSNANATPSSSSSSLLSHMTDAQAALAKILPHDVDLDNSMMEHLARAAMELHNKRTGRGMLAEKSKSEAMAKKNVAMACIAWSVEEKERCLKATEKHGTNMRSPDVVDAIVRAVGTRSVEEVRAHVQNLKGREKIERKLGSTGTSTTPTTGTDNKKDGGGDDSSASKSESKSVLKKYAKDDAEAPVPEKEKQRRGRGRKPPSRAMLTMPVLAFDAKKMVSGSSLDI